MIEHESSRDVFEQMSVDSTAVNSAVIVWRLH
jgi:hypothetical protein